MWSRRELVVGGRFAVMDAQLLFEVMHALVGAAQHAGHIGADLDVVVAFRLRVEHVVEVDHRAHFGRLQFQHGRQFVLRVDGAIAELALDHVQRGQDGRALAAWRVEVHPLLISARTASESTMSRSGI